MAENCRICHEPYVEYPQAAALRAKLSIPPSRLCPRCRRDLRLAHWPFGFLRRRKCDLSGESIISIYGPDARFPVYKRDHWFGDSWAPPRREIEWGRPFLDQLYDLQCATPHFHKIGGNFENCDYADDIWDCRNIYLSRSCMNCEDLCYCYRVIESTDCLDITFSFNLEQCYECVYCLRCYNLRWSENCEQCSDGAFLYDCRSCHDCFMCWNLRNAEYCIRNQKFSKEEYSRRLAKEPLDSRGGIAALSSEVEAHLRSEAVHRASIQLQCEDSSGNYIQNCSRCTASGFISESQDCCHVIRGHLDRDCVDINGILRGELCAESSFGADLYRCIGALFSVDCRDSAYIDQCYYSHHLFGCVGLKRQSYCILNKEYPKEEWERLTARIRKDMEGRGDYGQFLPYRFAYVGHNLSLAAPYSVLAKDRLLNAGSFFEELPQPPKASRNASALPESAADLTEEDAREPVGCMETSAAFKLIPQEIRFYKRMNIPPPDKCPDARDLARFRKLLLVEGRPARCSSCGSSVETYQPPERGLQRVVCAECYTRSFS